MYNFSYFKEQDRQRLLHFMEEHPFAFLTGSTLSGKQVATRFPSCSKSVTVNYTCRAT